MNRLDAGLESAASPSDRHIPVMPGEVLEALSVRPGGRYMDATLGLGGHAALILERSSPNGTLVGVDQDPAALALARQRLAPYGDRVRFVEGNFSTVFAEEWTRRRFDGILADLGVSSLQMDDAARGFSIRRCGPLDMRMAVGGETALEYLRRVPETELESRLREAGEVRFARRLARRLREGAAHWSTTAELADAVARWIPRRGHAHPATRVFLALRMAVNQEMEHLSRFLGGAPDGLAPGGRLAVLTFHSTEDRIVKYFYRSGVGAGRLTAVFKKPQAPSAEEQRRNPRSRSAKLRVFEAA